MILHDERVSNVAPLEANAKRVGCKQDDRSANIDKMDWIENNAFMMNVTNEWKTKNLYENLADYIMLLSILMIVKISFERQWMEESRLQVIRISKNNKFFS